MFSFGLQRNKLPRRIYCDHASGTPIDPKVLREMQVYFADSFHNPSAIYKEGVSIRNTIDQARVEVAGILKATKEEIFFVDGGTEANNIAILGSVRFWQKNNRGRTPHVITTKIEHASVLETCHHLETEGVEVTYLSVDDNGYIDFKELKKSLKDTTVLVSIGYVNGEIGTIQNIREIMKVIRHHRKHHQSQYPYMHTDAVQAVNYVDTITVPQLGIDLMTINGSKIYGPKKIAVLFKKTGVSLDPIVFGGHQESGLRSGTENVPYIIGMARSLSLARKHQPTESPRLKKLQDDMLHHLKEVFDEIIINAENAEKIPNIVNVTFPKLSHEEIVIRQYARGIMCSVKSACRAGEDGDSHVIQAIAETTRRPMGSIRFSFGKSTTQTDLDRVLKELKDIIDHMYQTQKDYL